MSSLGKSAELRVLLGGVEYHPPVDWFDVEVLATFDQGEAQANITTDNFRFILDAYKRLSEYIDAGNQNGVGIFEPFPIKIDAYSTLGTTNVFDGSIVLKDATRNDTIREILAPIEQGAGVRTLAERLSGLSYLGLFEEGVITFADFVDVDYVVDNPNKGTEAIIVSITLFSLSKELANLVREIGTQIATAAGIAPAGAGGLVGASIYAAAALVLNIAYATALLAIIIDLAEDLVSAFAMPIRTHKGATLKTLLSKACEKLGYGFDSSIPELDTVVYLPSNLALDVEDGIKGFIAKAGTIERGIPQANDYGYLCDEMFQLCRNLFNARYQVVSGVVQFHSENSPYWVRNSTYSMPDVLEGPYTYNTDELNSNVLIRFASDQSDLYTLDEYQGTSYQVITEPKTLGPTGRTNITGLEEVVLPVALGSRKDELNGFERFLLTLANIVDNVAQAFNGGIDISSRISGKVGVLRVSQNNHAIPKLLKFEGNRLPVNHRELFSAKTLWNDYHSYKSFISSGFRRQRKVYTGVKIPFGYSDFEKVRDNSYFITAQGAIGKIEKLAWVIAQDVATVDYWIEYPYTKNLKETYIEPTLNGANVTTS